MKYPWLKNDIDQDHDLDLKKLQREIFKSKSFDEALDDLFRISQNSVYRHIDNMCRWFANKN